MGNPDIAKESPSAVTDVSSDIPVVLVIFDELPLATLTSDKNLLDGLWFPNFTALAGQSNWYRNASTVADFTTHAVPAILTGKYPNVGDRPKRKDPKASFTTWFGMPTARDHPNNLFTLLARNYRLMVFETVTSVCAESICGRNADPLKLPQRISALVADLGIVYAHIIMPPKLSTVLPAVTLDWSGFLAAEGVETADDTKDFMRFVESVDSESTPTLYFHHSTLPHNPWIYLPTGQKQKSRKISGIAGEHWGADESLLDQNYHRHVLQARYADRLLGLLLQKLRSEGVYDRALVIVTADHGASFKAGTSLRSISRENYHDILSIPLIIKRPYQTTPLIDDRAAETIDILPTIAAILGTDLPFSVDGQSLLTQPANPAKSRTVINKKGREFKLDFHYRNTSEVRKRKKRLRMEHPTDAFSHPYSAAIFSSNHLTSSDP